MRETRWYALFERQQDGKWKRISRFAYRKTSAVLIFQSRLLAHVLSGAPECCLKPVAKEVDENVPLVD